MRLPLSAFVRSGREDHRRERRDRPLQVWITVNGVLPDLVGVRGEVYFGLGFPIENAGLLVVEVKEFLTLLLVLEEGLIRSDDLGVLVQALAYPRAESDQVL